jgi:ADP-heptose:LPS heptosyltransferase
VVASSEAITGWAQARGLATVEPGDPAPFSAAGLLVAAENRRLHLAAAFGTRCVVLYGPGDPALYRPLGRHHVAVRRKAECSPCFAERCPLDLRCQRELDAAQVAAVLRPLIPA